MRIRLIEGIDKVLSDMREKSSSAARGGLENMGVEVAELHEFYQNNSDGLYTSQGSSRA